MQPLNLIWQTTNGEQTTFELEYIEFLFSNIPHNKHFDNSSYNTLLDNSIVIYSNNQRGPSFEFINYLNKFKKNNFTFRLWHLSNETLMHNCDYYSLSNHVFRNYYYEDIKHLNNVTYLPLGFKSGYLNNQNNFQLNEKQISFSFIGQPKSDRIELIDKLQSFTNSFIHTTNAWNCNTALTQTQVIDIYRRSRFVPCPKGWINPDSFRIMEALESGAIPILKDYGDLNYFLIPWEANSPIPIVKEWDDIQYYDTLSDAQYAELYDDVFNWYTKFREKLKTRILDLL